MAGEEWRGVEGWEEAGRGGCGWAVHPCLRLTWEVLAQMHNRLGLINALGTTECKGFAHLCY